MANEFNAKGRRMVFEEDIEKIGQGGGGDVSIDDFKAGPGIALDEDLSTNQIVIEVEQEDIPFKTDFKTVNNESIIGTGNIDAGANFVDFVDLGDSLRDLTETEYNQVLNGLKRPKYRGMVYQVSHIVLEPDWSGFTGLILQPTTLNGVETGQGQVKSWFMKIYDADYSTPYYVEVSDNNLVVANDADTPLEALTTLRVGSGVYSVLPPCPTTTDGTYVLEATVSSGVVTYNWVLKV